MRGTNHTSLYKHSCPTHKACKHVEAASVPRRWRSRPKKTTNSEPSSSQGTSVREVLCCHLWSKADEKNSVKRLKKRKEKLQETKIGKK